MLNIDPSAVQQAKATDEQLAQQMEQQRLEAEVKQRRASLMEQLGNNHKEVILGMSVHNTQLVPRKILGIIQEALRLMPTHTMNLFVFQKDLPAGDNMGEYYPAVSSAAINVSNVVRDAHEQAEKTDNRISAMALAWMGLCSTCLHEIAHSCPEIGADDDAAKAKSYEVLRTIAKTMNIEVPSTEGAGWWGLMVDGMMEHMGDIDEDWAKLQVKLTNRKCLWLSEKEDVELKSMREWLRFSDDGPSRNDEVWLQPVVDIALEIHQVPTAGAAPSVYPGPAINADGVANAVEFPMMPQEMVTEMGFSPENPAGIHYQPQGAIVGSPTPMNFGADTTTPAVTGGAPAGNNDNTSNMMAPAITLDAATALNVKQMVFARLFHHMFSKCGFLSNGLFDDNAKHNIREGVMVSDIPGVQEIFLGFDAAGPTGAFTKEIPLLGTANGMIRGWVSKDGNISYILHVNANGRALRIRMAPQRPGTQNASQIAASQGNPVAWVSIMGGGLIYKVTFENGQIVVAPCAK